MKIYHLVASFSLSLALLTANAAAADLKLEVDLSQRELVARVNGKEVERYVVFVGEPKNPTPKGTFKVAKIVWNPSWVPPDAKWAKDKKPTPPGHPDNPMKKVKIFFREPDYYIHGTADHDSLGHAKSHGCIRMHPDEAASLARKVMEHGGKPMPEPWYRRIFRSRKTAVVRLAAPVTLQIKA